jgi:hypothetical protein
MLSAMEKLGAQSSSSELVLKQVNVISTKMVAPLGPTPTLAIMKNFQFHQTRYWSIMLQLHYCLKKMPSSRISEMSIQYYVVPSIVAKSKQLGAVELMEIAI